MKKMIFLLLAIASAIAGNAQKKKNTDTIPVKTNLAISPKVATTITSKPVTTAVIDKPATTTASNPAGTPITSNPATTTNTQSQTKANPPAATTAPQAAALTDNDYFLSVVKVSISTGKDNKEYPSGVSIEVHPANSTGFREQGFLLDKYKNEMKVWSTNELLIPQRNQNVNYDAAKNTLALYRQHGVYMELLYWHNLVFDAWKIESIKLTLEFKDAKGNPHPTMGSKTISFADSNMWMDAFDKKVTILKTDPYFNAMPMWQGSFDNYFKLKTTH